MKPVIRLELDRTVDAAYIYVGNGTSKAAHTYPCDSGEIDAQIFLDFDDAGRLIGVEVLDASRHLAPEILAIAEKPALSLRLATSILNRSLGRGGTVPGGPER